MTLSYYSKTISAGKNSKTVKGDKVYLTAIMYLAPWKLVKGFNACPMAEKAACHEACLNTAGRGKMDFIQRSRIAKTKRFVDDREQFMLDLHKDITRFVKFCSKRGVKPAVRLNGTSDIRWELIKYDGKSVFEHFPEVQFYDYTKIANRKIPSHVHNYHLTWSYSNADPDYEGMWLDALDNDMNVAVVFRDKDKIPYKFLNMITIDGDKDDLRFLDPPNSVVSLVAKGKAKKDTTGFVVG